MPEENSKKYHKIKNWLFLINLLVNIAILVLLLVTGLSIRFRDLAYSIANNFYFVVSSYFILLSVTSFVISLPLDIYEGYILEKRFNLATSGFLYFIKKHIKKTLISLIIGVALLEVLYFFLRNFTNIWWILAGAMWFLFSIIFARIVPVVIVPLFYKYKPINDSNLKQRIMDLAKKCNIKILDVFEIDLSKETKKANAGVIGIGKSRRIVLSDTLIQNYSLDEIEIVLAHEFGHHVKRHMPKLIAISAATTFVSLYILNIFLAKALGVFSFSSVSDIAAFPVLALILLIFGLFMMPLQNGYSRILERESDLFALDTTKNKEAFISMMEKLAKQNLDEKEPSKFIEFMLYDHPAIGKRIQFAKEFKVG